MPVTLEDAEHYAAWYRTPRGRWIADREFELMLRLLSPSPGASLLDVGSGTGEFGRRFVRAGLEVVGLDPSPYMLAVARRTESELAAVRAGALALPFADRTFDYVAAVTSLCFVEPAARALAEMWRVCRQGVILGLLNRRSLLRLIKQDRSGYRGARWDSHADVRAWCDMLDPPPRQRYATGIFLPGGGRFARGLESIVPATLPWGGFLAVALHRKVRDV